MPNAEKFSQNSSNGTGAVVSRSLGWDFTDSPSVAGILNSLTHLFTLLIGIFYYKNTVGIHKIIGVLIGFFGAIILIYFNSKSSF